MTRRAMLVGLVLLVPAAAATQPEAALTIVGGTVVNPEVPPRPTVATIVVEGNRITHVGPDAQVVIPRGAQIGASADLGGSSPAVRPTWSSSMPIRSSISETSGESHGS